MTPHDVDARSASSGSFPKFEPHITLASIPSSTPSAGNPVSIEECFRSCTQKPLDVTFRSVEIGSHYFRSVYIAVNLSPDLATLHQKIHAGLLIDPNTPVFPHLSLCYVTDEDEENGLRHQFFDALRIREDSHGGIALLCRGSGASDDEDDWIGGFKASEIWITRCEGPVESWEILDVYRI